MFRSARVQLTAWYLLIIMLISIAFSLAIYLGVTSDLRGRFEGIERRMMEGGDFRMPQQMHRSMHGDLQASQRRVLMILLFANGTILILSSMAGYFLAGKTLEPIERSLDEQKRFVADASHELRTPLTSLKTSIEVALRDKKLSKNVAVETLRSSLEDVDNLETLTTELLSLAQHQKTEQNMSVTRIDLNDVLASARSRVSTLATERKVSLKIDAEPVQLDADRQDLEKLTIILLDNAVKYTPEGGHVTVAFKDDGKNALITIKDTGIGIDREELSHIFDRFYRADQSRSKIKVPGFGLGLSIAKRIVDSHSGSIDVSSAIGTGTTFAVRLPLRHS